MKKRTLSLLASFVFVVGTLAIGVGWGNADTAPKCNSRKCITTADRLAAAERAAAARLANPVPLAVPPQGGTPNYFGPEPNWAYSPQPSVNPGTGAITGGIRKFVDALPGLGAASANGLGQFVSVAHPDTITYPGYDYYEIELHEYTKKMHSDLNPTTLRGYVQVNMGTNPATNQNTIAPDSIQYLGPVIVAQRNRPVRIKFTNKLSTGAGGNLFLPVDTTLMGAGMGPLGTNVTPGNPVNYTQNRASMHLHGGLTPWISDGTPYQWITPAGENTDYPVGVSVKNVPDMPDPGPGSMTFFYSNQQSARLMFYHDHAVGITRLNVYAGVAAGYLIRDAVEQQLITNNIIPVDEIPLVIQDKTFIDPTTVLATDPTWPFAVNAAHSDLWYPHVWMPNQNPNDIAGINPLGRWDYGPWFWPPWPVANPPITLPDGTQVPNVPDLSTTMEAFMDTPVVNGTAYPYVTVQPKAYRLRILNAANDRFWNLSLWQADPTVAPGSPGYGKEVKMLPTGPVTLPAGWPAYDPGLMPAGMPDPTLVGPDMIQIGTEGGFLPAPVVFTNIPLGYDKDPKSITVGNVLEHNLFLGPAERADVIVDFSQFAGKTIILYNDAPAAVPATDFRLDYFTGHPDLTAIGGTVPTIPGYGPNTRTIMQIRVANTAAAPAYSLTALNNAFASTASTPGVFEQDQDPIIVPQEGYNSAYNATFPNGTTAYARIQDTSLTFTPLDPVTLQLTAPLTVNFESKAIAEEFESTYGRMRAFLGVELPFTNGGNQTTIFYGYIDPTTEILSDNMTPLGPVTSNGTQLWKITHNGVDTHPVHFHLFNVQLVNRVDWAGVVKPPEPNELGWKETVRMNPLEDIIVAIKPYAPQLPFGVPNSVRPLAPSKPLGDTTDFAGVDPNGNPITVTNVMTDFGWEYVWHCHILSHEENDMMRPMSFLFTSLKPASPALSVVGLGVPINLSWTDATPPTPAYPQPGNTWGSPQNEIGFQIQRAAGGGSFVTIGTALANQTTYSDATANPSIPYKYRVVAYNQAGSSTSNTVSIAGGPLPDLIESAVGNPPSAAVAGSTFSMNDTAKNQGTVSAGSSTTRFYLSLDTIKDNGDVMMGGERAVPALAVNATSSGTTSVAVPTTIAAGSYYVLACADNKWVVIESIEGNNCRASANKVTVSVPTGPDLIETAVSNPPGAAVAGGSFSVTDTVKNQGVGAAGASVTRYYLSTDKVKWTGDVLMGGSRSVPALAGGATNSGTTSVTVPASMTPGTYFVIACADNTWLVTENIEGNNCTASGTEVTVSSATGPDLVESSVGNPPASAAKGSSFSISDTVMNQGNATAGASVTRYYLSTDQVKWTGDILMGGSRAVPALTAGASNGGTVSVTVPANAPSGTYYVLACADNTWLVTESVEGNNCSSSATTVNVP